MERDTVEPRVESLPGESARRTVDFHHRHAAPSTYVYDFVWDYTAPAIGPFCTDVDGNVLLDFTAQVGTIPLGYNNPKVMDPLAEFDVPDPLTIAGQDFYLPAESVGDAPLPGPADLMARLTDISAQYGMDTVFLSNSGAEAVENALKISFDFTRGKYLVTTLGAFHGRTLGTLSLNRSKAVHRQQFPEIASVEAVPFCTDRDCSAATCDCGFFTGETSALRRLLGPGGSVDPAEVAAIVVEPVQGEGGYRIPSQEFGAELAACCDDFDVPLVADEIQSGLGRTGEWWASDHYAFDPDVIASAKGLRVGATISREEVFPDERSRLSSTWGAGDILKSAVGALTIDAIEEHDLLSHAETQGRQAVELLEEATLPGAVDVRGLGLMLAVEFESPEYRDAVMEAAFHEGLLTLGCGRKTLRLLPPLDVRDRELRIGVELLAEAAQTASV